MRLLVTGGTGVLGRALRPLAEAADHELAMPRHEELDLFDPSAVADAVREVDGVLHLATRIRTLEQVSDPDAWRENDRGGHEEVPFGGVIRVVPLGPTGCAPAKTGPGRES